MDWSFDAETTGHSTTAVIHGRLQVAEFLELLRHVRSDMLLQGGQGLILDFHDATLQISTLDLFGIATSALETLGRETPLAVVLAPGTLPQVDARFFENVVCNRGGMAQFFTETDAAETWLQGCLTVGQ
jgi:hypothetical protein